MAGKVINQPTGQAGATTHTIYRCVQRRKTETMKLYD
jgi:hypothetical protein